MDHHARCPKETLLHLPSLVPSRSTNWPSSTSLPKTGLPDRSPEEEAKEMAGASSRLFHRPPDSGSRGSGSTAGTATRSEEHTSELQSRLHLACRLLLLKKQPHP